MRYVVCASSKGNRSWRPDLLVPGDGVPLSGSADRQHHFSEASWPYRLLPLAILALFVGFPLFVFFVIRLLSLMFLLQLRFLTGLVPIIDVFLLAVLAVEPMREIFILTFRFSRISESRSPSTSYESDCFEDLPRFPLTCVQASFLGGVLPPPFIS